VLLHVVHCPYMATKITFAVSISLSLGLAHELLDLMTLFVFIL
jgi:hypothetical protein